MRIYPRDCPICGKSPIRQAKYAYGCPDGCLIGPTCSEHFKAIWAWNEVVEAFVKKSAEPLSDQNGRQTC